MHAILLCSLLLAASPTFAAEQALAFATGFGSHMVLPHDEPVIISGQAAPNAPLTLTVNDANYGVRSDSKGQWQTKIAPLHTGGPYTLTLKDGNGAATTLTDVLAGEVWLCSGQSNMEFMVQMSTDQPMEVMQGHSAIRLLQVAQLAYPQAQTAFEKSTQWQVATADSIKRFSALCYFFARRKLVDDGMPVGLINSSWGGSAIEAWVGEQQLVKLPGNKHQVQLLQQYRKEQRKAELAFADDWMAWWKTASTQGAVWQSGVTDNNGEWQNAPFIDWRKYPDQRLANFTGNVWFSKSFELTAAQSKKSATFVLGKIDEVDSTWLNGKFINNSFGYGTKREYKLEPGVLQAGTNQLTTFVTSTYDGGGMLGPEADVGIKFDDGEFLNLGSGWKYRFVPKDAGYPPRSPWESVHGVSGMYNGMIAPLAALTLTGAIWYQGESNVDHSSEYEALLTALIKDWRTTFKRELPFIIVQLPNNGAIATTPVESGWAALRNVQQQVALKDAKVGIVVTQDLGNDADIHPRRKWAVAERAVLVAHALQQGGNKNGVVPRMSVSGNQMTLEFEPVLDLREQANVAGFSVCQAQANTCVAAKAVQQGSHVVIALDAGSKATRLRYCWSDGGTCELKVLNGLPVASFELPLTNNKK